MVEVGPTQFRVSQGDTIVTEKLRGVDINDEISLNRVLMLGSRHETIIGRPFIPQAVVTAAVEVRDAAVAQLGSICPSTRLHHAVMSRRLQTCRRMPAQEQFQDGKVLIFKKRRRKHSRRLRGHRQVPLIFFAF